MIGANARHTHQCRSIDFWIRKNVYKVGLSEKVARLFIKKSAKVECFETLFLWYFLNKLVSGVYWKIKRQKVTVPTRQYATQQE